MTERGLVRRFVLLRALRWFPLGLVLPFFVLLPQDRGLGLAEIGVLFGTHSVVAIVLEVPSGGLADAIGRRPTLLLGGLLMAVSLAGFAVATGLAGFMLAAGTLAAGRALISGALEAWFVDELHTVAPETPLHGPLAKGSTAEALGTGLGAAIGGFLPVLTPGLPEHGDQLLLDLSVPFLAGGVAGLGYVVAVALCVREPRRTTPTGAWRGAAAATRAGLRAARGSRNVRLVLAVAAVIGLVMSTTELLWQPRLESLAGGNGATPLFGLLAAASMLTSGLGSATSPRFAALAGNRRVYAGAFVLAALALALLAVVQVVAVFCAVYLAFFFALGVSEPLHYAVLHEAIESETRATVASAEGLTCQVGGLGGNLVLTPLAGAVGLGVAWGIAAVFALGAAALAAATRPRVAVARPLRRPAAPSGAA